MFEQAYRNRVDKVIEAIIRDICGDRTTHSPASLAGISAFHFHRIFRALTGETMFAFVAVAAPAIKRENSMQIEIRLIRPRAALIVERNSCWALSVRSDKLSQYRYLGPGVCLITNNYRWGVDSGARRSTYLWR